MIGHNSQRLRRLKALDVSLTNVDDRGLCFLTSGLGQLEYLDLGNCTQLSFTGKGIQESLRNGSFRSMLVLNLRGCKGINDEGVIAIAKIMLNLKHLNLSHCGNITNKSACAIGQGCSNKLITLSLEGALAITDAGLGMIVNYTKLSLLNISGCSISRKSLMAVVLTLGYVQESSSFFGFINRDSDAKVASLNKEEWSNTREQQNHAAHIIQVSSIHAPSALYIFDLLSSFSFLQVSGSFRAAGNPGGIRFIKRSLPTSVTSERQQRRSNHLS